MKQPQRFTLLLVRRDGTRILRLNLPRRVLYGGLTVLALAVSALGAIYGDYISLKQRYGEVAALHRQAAEQQALIEAFHTRIGEIRGEISTWRGLHAKIWEPFGPEAGPAPKGTGIGGGAPVRAAFPGDRVAVSRELDLLSATVNEEGQSLRALERLIGKAGRALAALPSRWPVRNAERGTPVKAPAPGTVIFAGVQAEYGTTVILDHGNDVKSFYGHLQKIQVAQGQRVERGQVIALTKR